MSHQLDFLHEKYQRFTSLSDNVELFWTLNTPSSHSSLEDKNNDDDDDDDDDTSTRSSIDIAFAYLLPNDPLHRIEDRDDAEMKTTSSYWLAFGISEQGGMVGADMMIYVPPSSSSSTNNTNTNSNFRIHTNILDTKTQKHFIWLPINNKKQ